MTPHWRREEVPQIVRALATRPRHEALLGHLTELLRSGFGAPYEEIGHEVYLLDRSGRIDTMWGATVIELKSDLRREIGDVLARMPDYLADAAPCSGSQRPATGRLLQPNATGQTWVYIRSADGKSPPGTLLGGTDTAQGEL